MGKCEAAAKKIVDIVINKYTWDQ